MKGTPDMNEQPELIAYLEGRRKHHNRVIAGVVAVCLAIGAVAWVVWASDDQSQNSRNDRTQELIDAARGRD